MKINVAIGLALVGGIGITAVIDATTIGTRAYAAGPRHKARTSGQNNAPEIAGGGILKHPGAGALYSTRGYYIGTDPNAWTRSQLLRDPPGSANFHF
jgi:hypothetical protein